MFDEGITTGQNPSGQTVLEKFGHNQQLTRAQAVVFFHRMHQQGKTVVSEKVVEDKIVTPVSKDPVVQKEIEKKLEVAKKEAVAKVDSKVTPPTKAEADKHVFAKKLEKTKEVICRSNCRKWRYR